jgi:membrane protein YdbS with pleckstrin-like domain
MNRDSDVKEFKILALHLSIGMVIMLAVSFATFFFLRSPQSSNIPTYLVILYAIIYNIIFFKKQMRFRVLSHNMLYGGRQ